MPDHSSVGSDQLAVARRFRTRGLSVIPVPAPRAGVPRGQPGDGKVPAIPWREYQSRLPTDDEIKRWFGRGPMNLAVVTGARSQVVVIDADSPDAMRWAALNLPYTHWQTLTAHGYHLWYRHPGMRVTNRARIDVNDRRVAI